MFSLKASTWAFNGSACTTLEGIDVATCESLLATRGMDMGGETHKPMFTAALHLASLMCLAMLPAKITLGGSGLIVLTVAMRQIIRCP